MIVTVAAYLHTIDPYAIKLWEGGPIRWYGLSYLAGFLIAYGLVRRVAVVGRTTLQPEKVGDLIVTVAIGIVVGGRLGYTLFYRPDLMWSFSSDPPYWGALAINEGGMASHGGIIGGIVAMLWYSRRHQHSWPHLLDLLAFGGPLGLLLGRVANFVNGELIGRACSPDLPWAVKFPQEIYRWNSEQLSRLDPVLSVLTSPDPARVYGWSAWLGIIVAEVQNGNEAVQQAIEPLLTPRHPSQLYGAALEGGVVFLVVAIAWMKPRKPLVVGCLGCVTYAIVRIFDELFREPDAHIGFQWLGMTRGQWLSIVLLVVAVTLLIVFSRRKVDVMGGWLRVEDDHAMVSTPGRKSSPHRPTA